MSAMASRAAKGSADRLRRPDRNVSAAVSTSTGRPAQSGAMAPFVCAVIDDDPDWADLVRRALERDGMAFTVKVFTDAESALDDLRSGPVDVVICDLHMPKLNGLAFTREFRNGNSETPVIIITSDAISQGDVQASGATRYVPKRTLNSDLPAVVRRLLGAAAR